MPGLPTVAESGLRGYESSQWDRRARAGRHAGRHPRNALNAQVVRIMQAAEIRQRLIEDGLVPVGNTRAQFAAHIKTELVKWANVVKQSGARID